MNVENVIRDVTVRGSAPGMDQVARAYNQVADGADRGAISYQNNAKAGLAVDSMLEKQRRTYQDAYREQQKYVEAQRVYQRAVEQGLITQRQATVELGNVQAKLADQTRAANDNTKAANDNAAGWRLSGVEMASVANHAKQAAVAAYVLSPAFRSLVDPAIRAGLGATGTALAAMGPVAASVATSIGTRLVGALLHFLPIAGQIMLVIDAIKLMAFAWNSAGAQLEAYNNLAKDAAATGVTTDFLQRITKGADQAADALKKLAAVSADKLGGSELQNRLDALTKAGNFAGNTGVAAFAGATNTEEKFRAIVSLVDQAMQKGQRLAALDLTAKFLPAEMQEKLAKNSDYLNQMLKSADAIAATKLVKQADIDGAVALQSRYDAAVKILSERWIPFQDTITAGGMVLQRIWVGIVEAIAAAFTALTNFGAAMIKLPQLWFQFSKQLFAAVSGTGEQFGPKYTDPKVFATGQLRTALANPANVTAARDQTNVASNLFRKDTSFDPDKVKKVDDVNDAVDRAINTLRRHIEAQKADGEAIGLGDAALARFRAEAQQTAAMQANGGKITAEQARDFEKLKVEAYDAAAALADLKLKAQIDWQKKTMFLSPEDVQIATQLQGKYGTDVPRALASTEAAIIRVQSAQSMLVTGFRDIGDSVVAAALKGGNAMAALNAGLDALAAKMAKAGFNNAVDGLLSGNLMQAGLGAAQMAGSAIISAFTGDQKKQEELRKARAEWEKSGPAFSAFLKHMTGGVQGNLAQTIAEAAAQEAAFEDQAWKARDTAAINAARAGIAKFTQTQKELFNATFDAVLSGLSDGMGLDSPFMKGVSNIKTALNAQLAFIDDTDVARGGKAVDLAKQASQSYLLSLLQTPAALSPVQSGLMQIRGAANALQGALVQLGMSSGDAARAISEGVTAAMAGLKRQFESGLTERLNTAGGQSFLNDATKLIAQHQQDVLDAAALGSDPALVAAVFHAEAQKIVDDADLVGDAFTDFTKQFPLLADVVTQSSAALEAAAKQQRDALNASAKSTVDYVNALYAGPNSALSPQKRLAAAETTYNAKLALAQANDAGALSTITQDFENLRLAMQANFASGTQYQQFLSSGIAQLLNLPNVQETTDPVVAAMRDVLTAVNLGNAALNIINATAGGTTGAVNAANSNIAGSVSAANSIGTLTGQILPAVNAGNAVAVAANLAAYFDNLNAAQASTTGALTGQILPAVNSGNAASTAAALTGLFNQIDPSGKLASMVGMTQSISAYSVNTAGNTASTRDNVATNNSLTATANSLVTASNSFLTAINTFADRIIQAINAQGSMQAGNFGQLILNSAVLLNWMPKLVTTGKETAGGDGGGGNNPVGYSPKATGGWITGGIPGRDSVHILAQRDEFMVNANATRALTQQFGSGVMDVINSGRLPFNDNSRPFSAATIHLGASSDSSPVVTELRELRRSNDAMLRVLAAVGAAIVNAETKSGKEVADAIVGAIGEQTAAIRAEARQDRTNPQMKAA